jgi:hypothetical protein
MVDKLMVLFLYHEVPYSNHATNELLKIFTENSSHIKLSPPKNIQDILLLL